MAPPLWLVAGVLVLGVATWVGLHWSLRKKKIEQTFSRIVMIEMVPAFSFSVTTWYLLFPSFYYLVIAERLSWASAGMIWRLATFIGAAALSLSPIAWIGLLEDEVPAQNQQEQPSERSSPEGTAHTEEG